MSEVVPVVRARTPSFFNKPLFRIQSETLSITDAAKQQNDLFNTNLGAINVQMAMVIHRLDVQLNPQGFLGVDAAQALVLVLSEDTSQTSALTAGQGTRTLWFTESDFTMDIATSGVSSHIEQVVKRVELDPWPIWTIAQQLNWLGEMVELVAGTAPDFNAKIDLWYSLEPVDAQLRSRLLERLNLAL